MQVRIQIKVDIDVPGVMDIVNDVAEEGLLDTVTETANDVVRESPWKTGHNRRSIAYMVGGAMKRLGRIKTGEEPFGTGKPGIRGRLTAAIWSSSGYGGWLEVGHHRGTTYIPPRPYMAPAARRHFPDLARNIAKRLRMRGG